jgi:ectoine hydroxylase-related dioxygenase (phytanoyl-CoA dioxygenase family)
MMYAKTVAHLPRTAVDSYERDGFLFPIDAFDAEEAAAWAREIAALPTPALAAHRAPWVQKAYLLLPSLDALMRDPRLTGPVASILGEDLLVLSADLFIKPPRTQKKITWHQDVNYWGLEPMQVLTAWVAFIGAAPENGCMRYSRGGHRARLRHIERKTDDNMLTRGQEIAVEIDDSTVVDVCLRPGQVAFHDGLTPHASGANNTDATRTGFAIRYAPTRAKQTSGPPITARLVRGSDSFGHFELEGGPYRALSDEALAAHQRALAPHAASAYSTI